MILRAFPLILASVAVTAVFAAPSLAQDIASPATPGAAAPFDIRSTSVTVAGDYMRFRLVAAGPVGISIPAPTGAVAGSHVAAYVWPTGLDSAAAGFEAGQGVLALAATAHPDFDDTPLYDENGDGNLGNDGANWHSHWVVLTPDDACGAGNLKVKDIPAGTSPRLPQTWPGLPILLDSPGYTPRLAGNAIEVDAPAALGGTGTPYDGVTAALRVNADMAAPLLCVVQVHDVASGNLSLPGRIAAK